MLLVDFIRQGVSALEGLYPTAEARSIVLMLCEELIGTKSYTHIVEPQFEIDKKSVQPLAEAMVRLQAGEPIQYVIGRTEFCGYNFRVTRDVLIPRPETELLVREAIKIADRIKRMRIPFGKSAEPVRVLDLCTGSGNIAWSVALAVPGTRVVGVDISEEALSVARNQDFSALLKSQGALAPTFVAADILDTEQEFNYGAFDLILSNPPYIMEKERPLLRRNVVDYEPARALFVPDDNPLLFYKAVVRWSERFLSPEGKGLTEINEVLGKETEALFRESGFSQTDLVKDFYDKNRFVFYMR
ncbi:MAG: peptide chain release factor N(5)-glutamine methyltransferase [Bacteroidales bacterium]|nr:peptide chain release factor N(5)-glutamine methyltransferase [Bacteroidales bacterium]